MTLFQPSISQKSGIKSDSCTTLFSLSDRVFVFVSLRFSFAIIDWNSDYPVNSKWSIN